MSGRRMPVQCEHGRVSDWGDFGQPGAEPELCYYCRQGCDLKELQDIVYRHLVNQARENDALKAALEPLGFFRLLDLVDGLVEVVQHAYATGTPLASADTSGVKS